MSYLLAYIYTNTRDLHPASPFPPPPTPLPLSLRTYPQGYPLAAKKLLASLTN